MAKSKNAVKEVHERTYGAEREKVVEATTAEIVKKFELSAMTEYMKASGAEAVILGCTHFPHFKKELVAVCNLKIIDPADEMYASMLKE